MSSKKMQKDPDIILIGAGIMSATLGILIKELQPDWSIEIYERLDTAAAESSDAWNNAGTGHSAFCELNYTPELEDGSIDISKAIKIASSFEVSKQLWSYLVSKKVLKNPPSFIHSIPHLSFVWGNENAAFLKKRFDALIQCHLFEGMQFSEDATQISDWAPLVMQGRDITQKIAATKMDLGTDVNFGSLTRCLFTYLKEQDGVTLYFNHEIEDLQQDEERRWHVLVNDLSFKEKRRVATPFVFIGAGGGSLPLLLQSGIPEGKGYGGFPVSGQWLRCTKQDVIEQHNAKVYGLAGVGAPPMSVPHLDTRWIKAKKELLFGPYAGFTTKFLKHGSVLDLFKSIQLNNIRPMMAAGIHNIPLTKYLIEQVRLTPEGRLKALQEYFPDALIEDWELEIAGQRVQVIKKDEEQGGILEFGTEVVSAADGSIAVLLGASPGASTAVSIMIALLERCFSGQIKSQTWQQNLKSMIPSYGKSMANDKKLCREIRELTSTILHLK